MNVLATEKAGTIDIFAHVIERVCRERRRAGEIFGTRDLELDPAKLLAHRLRRNRDGVMAAIDAKTLGGVNPTHC